MPAPQEGGGVGVIRSSCPQQTQGAGSVWMTVVPIHARPSQLQTGRQTRTRVQTQAERVCSHTAVMAVGARVCVCVRVRPFCCEIPLYTLRLSQIDTT